MSTLFEGLTESEIDYLKYLQKRGYFDGFEMFCNTDASSDYRVDKLIKGGYMTMDDSALNMGKRKVTILKKGLAALIDFDKYKNQIQPLRDEIAALNKIANSLQEQVSLARESSAESKKDVKFSKIISIISTIIAVFSLVVAVISLFT